MNSIVSYPDRGVGGNNTYRGNCSPRLIEDLIKQYKVSEISDYMSGSGTTEDVAKQMGVESHCYDLNMGFDLLHCDIKERSQFIFWHPPYGTMVTYAGEQYSAEKVQKTYGFDPRLVDLSRNQPWESFVKELNYCMLKQFAALEKGGRMGVLVGDLKRKGKLYSMVLELAKPGTLEQIIVKAQHNCWSDSVQYSRQNFVPIKHEYLVIVRKDNPLLFALHLPYTKMVDMRDLNTPTWRDVIAAVMEDFEKPATLAEIYSAVEGHKRTEANPHWKDKVRQTLRVYPDTFHLTQNNAWQLAG